MCFGRDRWQLNSLINCPSLLKKSCIGLGTSYLTILNLRILGLNTFISISSISDSRTFFFLIFFNLKFIVQKNPLVLFSVFLHISVRTVRRSLPLPPPLLPLFSSSNTESVRRISVDGQPPQWSEAPPGRPPQWDFWHLPHFCLKESYAISNRAQQKGNIQFINHTKLKHMANDKSMLMLSLSLCRRFCWKFRISTKICYCTSSVSVTFY
jgi:hypothetical protein